MNSTASDLAALFDIDLVGEALPPASWNIAPTSRISVVIDTIPKGADEHSPPVRRLEAARWGLVPPWAKDLSVGVTAFNARIETAASKPMFSAAVKKRRAAVPATGYYEWSTVEGIKTPRFIHLPDDELLVFAGLYEWWRNPEAADDAPDKWLLSTTILTRAATGELAHIHDRMPVFLDPAFIDEWLDPSTEGGEELLEEVAAVAEEVAKSVENYEVDRAVGNVHNNSAELTTPV